MTTRTRFDEAIERIDAAHAGDPEQDATGQAKELVYAQRMSAWLEKLAPHASEALKLAVRCQHLRRWAIPRRDYPEGRAGYLRWRREQSLAHAALAGDILLRAGYDTDTIKRVQSLVRKERIKHDPEAQALEDATCLVFLERDFAPFAARYPVDKVIDVLRKSWKKMSDDGHRAALGIDFSPALRTIVDKALEAGT